MPDTDWEELATQVLSDAVADVAGNAEPTGQHRVHHATCPVVVIRDSVTGAAPGTQQG